MLGDALEVLRIVAILASPAMPAGRGGDLARLGLSTAPCDAPGRAAAGWRDLAWGGYPGGLPVEKGGAALPAPASAEPGTAAGTPDAARERPAPLAWTDSHCHLQDEYLDEPAQRRRGARAGRRRRCREARLHRDGPRGVAPRRRARRRRGRSGRGRRSDRPAARIWATVGLHPHEASDGVEPVAALLEELRTASPVPRARRAAWSASASAGSTTTTSTRRARRSGRPSPRRSPSPSATTSPSSSTPATPGTTPSTSSAPRVCRSGRSSTASPAARTRRVAASTSAPSSPSAGS